MFANAEKKYQMGNSYSVEFRHYIDVVISLIFYSSRM